MNLTRNILGSIVLTIATLMLINSIGNILVSDPTPSGDDGQVVAQTGPEKVAVKAPAPEPEKTVSAPAPAPAPAPKTIVADSGYSGNVALGKKMYRRKCIGCHPVKPDGVNRTGPNLFGIIGRNKASAKGFRYSSALKKLGGTWQEKELATFMAGPRAMVPNTKMTFAGLKKEDQRIDIIAYLRTFKN